MEPRDELGRTLARQRKQRARVRTPRKDTVEKRLTRGTTLAAPARAWTFASRFGARGAGFPGFGDGRGGRL